MVWGIEKKTYKAESGKKKKGLRINLPQSGVLLWLNISTGVLFFISFLSYYYVEMLYFLNNLLNRKKYQEGSKKCNTV